MKLPTKPTRRAHSLGEATVLLYSQTNGFGKTKTASQIPDHLLILTEDGANFYETTNVRVQNWAEFLAVKDELQKGGHGFKTIIIDTIDRLAKMALDQWCVINKGVAPRANWNDGGRQASNRFNQTIEELIAIDGVGLWMLGRADNTAPEGDPAFYEVGVPSLMKNTRRGIQDAADIIFYARVEKGKRILYSDSVGPFVARDRSERLPERIELADRNSNFQTIQEAFDNEQRSNIGNNRSGSNNKKRRQQRPPVGNGALHSDNNGNNHTGEGRPVSKA